MKINIDDLINKWNVTNSKEKNINNKKVLIFIKTYEKNISLHILLWIAEWFINKKINIHILIDDLDQNNIQKLWIINNLFSNKNISLFFLSKVSENFFNISKYSYFIYENNYFDSIEKCKKIKICNICDDYEFNSLHFAILLFDKKQFSYNGSFYPLNINKNNIYSVMNKIFSEKFNKKIFFISNNELFEGK